MNNSKFPSVLLIFVYIFSAGLSTTSAAAKDWWETTTIYQVYIRSFKDSNGDGIGDLNGIYEKLDYLKEIQVETIWIQPFYKSPMADFGYDVSDYKDVDPLFGTLDDFVKLVDGIHSRGMKVILDLVPNHVSDESEWFQKSVKREEPYTDFFVWHDSKGVDPVTKRNLPPNNWLSVFDGSAWEWNEQRKQFYLRQFLAKQPDLNYRNPKVKEAMEDVILFWLDLGVDGFRIDAPRHIFEAAHLKDQPYHHPQDEGSPLHRLQSHIYTTNQEENYELFHEWRLLLDRYMEKDNKTRIFLPEVYGPTEVLMRYFGNETYRSSHLPLNFRLTGYNIEQNASIFNDCVHFFIDMMPKWGVANWVLSSHDLTRVASRGGPGILDALHMIELILPGVAVTYYGDEIGMEEGPVREDQKMDPRGRDRCRTPMQWDESENAGFTSNKRPWLPVHPNFWFNNVARQKHDPYSHLSVYRRLMSLRKSSVLRDGVLKTCVLSDWVFMISRELDNESPIVAVINLGSESEHVCAKDCINSLPNVMRVHTSSGNSNYKPGDEFSVGSTRCSKLRPKAGVVLTIHAESSAERPSFLISALIILSITIPYLTTCLIS